MYVPQNDARLESMYVQQNVYNAGPTLSNHLLSLCVADILSHYARPVEFGHIVSNQASLF